VIVTNLCFELTLCLLGYFDLLIKTYKTGNLSEYLSYLEEGETVPMMGPFGEWQYIDGAYQRLVMFAAGSGVTPMYRVRSYLIWSLDDLRFVMLLCRLSLTFCDATMSRR